jgi:hypothetical protein
MDFCFKNQFETGNNNTEKCIPAKNLTRTEKDNRTMLFRQCDQASM